MSSPNKVRTRQSAAASRQRQAHGSSQNPTGFLSLPREIRDKIYREVLVHSDHISLAFHNEGEDEDEDEAKDSIFNVIPDSGFIRAMSPLGILSVNKQIHEEAVPIFYGLNSFSFDSAAGMVIFGLLVGDHNCELVRSVVIPSLEVQDDPSDDKVSIVDETQSEGALALQQVLAEFPGITTLQTSLGEYWSIEVQLQDLDYHSPGTLDRALQMLDARYREVPLLKELQVCLPILREPDLAVRDKMRCASHKRLQRSGLVLRLITPSTV